MNLSKLSNEADEFQSDWSVIEAAHRLSNHPHRLTEKEVGILQPDVVITMNLGDKLGALGVLETIEEGMSVDCWRLTSAGHRSLLIDTFHFAAPNKNDIRDFYEPVCHAVRKHLEVYS